VRVEGVFLNDKPPEPRLAQTEGAAPARLRVNSLIRMTDRVREKSPLQPSSVNFTRITRSLQLQKLAAHRSSTHRSFHSSSLSLNGLLMPLGPSNSSHETRPSLSMSSLSNIDSTAPSTSVQFCDLK